VLGPTLGGGALGELARTRRGTRISAGETSRFNTGRAARGDWEHRSASTRAELGAALGIALGPVLGETTTGAGVEPEALWPALGEAPPSLGDALHHQGRFTSLGHTGTSLGDALRDTAAGLALGPAPGEALGPLTRRRARQPVASLAAARDDTEMHLTRTLALHQTSARGCTYAGRDEPVLHAWLRAPEKR
jgi:hypothetical protein